MSKEVKQESQILGVPFAKNLELLYKIDNSYKVFYDFFLFLGYGEMVAYPGYFFLCRGGNHGFPFAFATAMKYLICTFKIELIIKERANFKAV